MKRYAYICPQCAEQHHHRIEPRRANKPGPPRQGRCEWCREETGTYTVLDMDVEDYR